MNRFIASIVLSLLAFSVVEELQAATVGTPAPAFELVTFSGETYGNPAQKGRPVLLMFWAPWCKVCQRDLSLLSEFYQRDRPGQLGVVSIGFADTISPSTGRVSGARCYQGHLPFRREGSGTD